MPRHAVSFYGRVLLETRNLICFFFSSRWVRLLFGREFPMNRLLILWDAIFASGMALELVEYIYVAMLIHLRGVCKYTFPLIHKAANKTVFTRCPGCSSTF